jgi:uncharacterized OB-fold protein
MTTEYRKPLPNPLNLEVTKPFWEAAKRHELLMPRCQQCNRLFFYPREACPNCLSPDIGWETVSGKGKLYSYTIINQPANPAFRADAPYIYGIVELDEGPRMVTNLVDCPLDEVKVDMPVTVAFDDVTEDVTLIKFRPA